ncbi:YrdC/Sua5 family protein, required for threonylcarbamoyladenosine (t(6)A) formation in tRNA [Lachnospiraceae bacterium TWA4]|nr:YrdC/Sua5 family protein, required for threonylcarbamoyladenosine (t(6)A) formation in tRNA [Lachnospiraceae bacterium TWA4]
METKIVKANTESDFKEAAKIIRSGGLVAFPTETVYGLGGNALDPMAAKKIYEAKGRPSDNPLIAHISSLEQLTPLVKTITPLAKSLMDKFWPGPMTLIFNKSELVPLETTGGLQTVAVRMPNHPVALKLIQEANVPIAAPSANLSGKPSPTKASHVIEDLSGRIDMILDGGDTDIGIESTIIDVTSDEPVILRPGFITSNQIGQMKEDSSVPEDRRPKAPGMKYKHYAPKASLVVIKGKKEDVLAELLKHQDEGIICTDETRSYYSGNYVKSIGSRKDVKSVAHNLYRVLREFDETPVKMIYSESFDETELGLSVMNRLLKAAGHQVIEVGKKGKE